MLLTGPSGSKAAMVFFDVDICDNSHDATVRKTIRLMAKIPTAIACSHRFAHDLEPVAPDAELD